MAALDDRPRPGKEPTITAEARTWLVSLACRKAKDLGYPHELWTTRLLVRHAREHGPAEGRACLGKLVQGTLCNPRLVVEDAAEVLAVGKDLVLVGQVRAARVDQVDARQPVLRRDLLRPQVLLHRQREVGSALDGGVVANDHAVDAGDAADAGDDPGARRRPSWPDAHRAGAPS